MAEALTLRGSIIYFSAHGGAFMAQKTIALYPCGLNLQTSEQVCESAAYGGSTSTAGTGYGDDGMLF